MKGKGDGKKTWNSDFWLQELSNLSSDHALKSECWSTPPVQEPTRTNAAGHDDYSDEERNDNDQDEKDSVDFDKIHIDWSLSDDDQNEENTKKPNMQKEPHVLFDDEGEDTVVRPISPLSPASHALSTSSITSKVEQATASPPPPLSASTVENKTLPSSNGWSLTSLVDFEPAMAKLAPALMPTPITPKRSQSTTVVPAAEPFIPPSTTTASSVVSIKTDDLQDNGTLIELAPALKPVASGHHPSEPMNPAMKAESPSHVESSLDFPLSNLSATTSEEEKENDEQLATVDTKKTHGHHKEDDGDNDDRIERDLEENIRPLESKTKVIRAFKSPPPQSTKGIGGGEDNDNGDDNEEEEEEEEETDEEVETISVSLFDQLDVQQPEGKKKSEPSVYHEPHSPSVSDQTKPLAVDSKPVAKDEEASKETSKSTTDIKFESAAVTTKESVTEATQWQVDLGQPVVMNTQLPGRQKKEPKLSTDQRSTVRMRTSGLHGGNEAAVSSTDAATRVQQQEESCTTLSSVDEEGATQKTAAVEEPSDGYSAEPEIQQGYQDASRTADVAITTTEQPWSADEPSVVDATEQQWSSDKPSTAGISPTTAAATTAEEQWSADKSSSAAVDMAIKAAEQQCHADETIAADLATTAAAATTQQQRSPPGTLLPAMGQSWSMQASTTEEISIADPVVATIVVDQGTSTAAIVNLQSKDKPIAETQTPAAQQSTNPPASTAHQWSSSASIWAPKTVQSISEDPKRSFDRSSTATQPAKSADESVWNSVEPSWSAATQQSSTESPSINTHPTPQQEIQQQEQREWSPSPVVSLEEIGITDNFDFGTGATHDFDFGLNGVHQQQQASYNNKVMEGEEKKRVVEENDDSDENESEYETDSEGGGDDNNNNNNNNNNDDDDDDDDDDGSSVEQITISLASLIQSKKQEEEKKRRQEIPVIRCTLTDLILGTKSEKIQNILAGLRGEMPRALAAAITDKNVSNSNLNTNIDKSISPPPPPPPPALSSSSSPSQPSKQKQNGIDQPPLFKMTNLTTQRNGMRHKQHDNGSKLSPPLQEQQEQDNSKEEKIPSPTPDDTTKPSVVEKAKDTNESNNDLKLNAFARTFTPSFASSPSMSDNNGNDADGEQEQEVFRYISAGCPSGADIGATIGQSTNAINPPVSITYNSNNNSLFSLPAHSTPSLFTPPNYFEESPSSSSSLFAPPKYFESDEPATATATVAATHYVFGSTYYHQIPASRPIKITAPKSPSAAASSSSAVAAASVAAAKRMTTSSQDSNNSSNKSTGEDSMNFATYTRGGTGYFRKQQPVSTISSSSASSSSAAAAASLSASSSSSSSSYLAASQPSQSDSTKLNFKAPVFNPSNFKP